ncbi:MAG: hypothetical protein AAGD00_07505 [Planctomycetota bacterium]
MHRSHLTLAGTLLAGTLLGAIGIHAFAQPIEMDTNTVQDTTENVFTARGDLILEIRTAGRGPSGEFRDVRDVTLTPDYVIFSAKDGARLRVWSVPREHVDFVQYYAK